MYTTRQVLGLTFPKIELTNFRSGNSKTSSVAAKYPMDKPLKLLKWEKFGEEVLKSVNDVQDLKLAAPYILPYPKACNDEISVQGEGDSLLFSLLKILMKTVSPEIEGEFVSVRGRKILCDPDRIWVSKNHSMPTMTIEFKTPWAMRVSGNIITAYNSESKRRKRGIKKGAVMLAIEQTYTYMSINRHRYGCLTTFDQTWFLKKEECTNGNAGSTLLVSPAISCTSSSPFTLTSAWFHMLMTIERGDDWLYSSPYSSHVNYPSFSTKRKYMAISRFRYVDKKLDGLLHWDTIIARSQAGAVATGSYCDLKDVVFKTTDILKNRGGKKEFDNEVAIYKELESLQGDCIPKIYAYGNLGGVLQVIVMGKVGNPITGKKSRQRKTEINAALNKIHELGVKHNDLRLPNILVDGSGKIRIIDFGMATLDENPFDERF